VTSVLVRGGAALIASVLMLTIGTSAWAITVDTDFDDGTARLAAREAARQRDHDLTKNPDRKLRLIDWMNSPACGGKTGYGPGEDWLLYPCPEGKPDSNSPNCGDEQPLPPLWSRSRETPDSAWSKWVVRSDWYCAVDVLPELTVAEFRTLPIPPSPLIVQPDRGWVLVNKETIAYSDDAEQTLHTELLGVGVIVIVKPESFTWLFGGEEFTTKSPGHPYPDQDVSRAFRKLGTERIRLTTTWSGRYQVEGDSRWRDVDGTATTTSTSPSFEVVERRSVLVNRD
jgi:hypothetical protein